MSQKKKNETFILNVILTCQLINSNIRSELYVSHHAAVGVQLKLPFSSHNVTVAFIILLLKLVDQTDIYYKLDIYYTQTCSA